MDAEEKKIRQREAARRWREKNPEKVKAENRKKRDRVYDPVKRKAWRESYIKRNPFYVANTNAQARRRKAEINEFLRKHKLDSGCADCGFNRHHAALEFHHLGGNKEINLSFAKSLSQAKREMNKCVVLCSNCHRIRHWE